MKKSLLFLLTIICLASCSTDEPKKPTEIWSNYRVDDVQFADGTTEEQSNRYYNIFKDMWLVSDNNGDYKVDNFCYEFRRWVATVSEDTYIIHYKTNDWIIERIGEGDIWITINKNDLSSIECEYTNKKPRETVRATCILEFDHDEEVEIDWYR